MESIELRGSLQGKWGIHVPYATEHPSNLVRIENLYVDGQGRFVRVEKNFGQGREGTSGGINKEIKMRLLIGRSTHGET
jgi:hypothetical protein